MSEPTLIMKLTALRDYVMVLGVSESDCDVFDEAVEAIVSARSAALEEAARVADEKATAVRFNIAKFRKGGTFSQHQAMLQERDAVALELISVDIRSLKDKQPDTRTPTEGESL